MKKILLYLAFIVCLVLGIYLLYLNFITEGDVQMDSKIIGGTLLVIAAFVFLQFANLDLYNEMNDLIQMVSNSREATVRDLFAAFEGLETPLGAPWMGQIKSLDDEFIIFGPDANGEFIYIGSFDDYFALALGDSPEMIEDFDEESVENNDGEILKYSFDSITLLEQLTTRFQAFLDGDAADTSVIASAPAEGGVYYFNEEFKLNGQDFHLLDSNGDPCLKIISKIPCKTFRIYDGSENEIFKLTKRIFHFLPTYDFYEGGKKLCRLKKRLVLHHDNFIGKTPYGLLELKSINATIGANYKVLLDGEQLGTISRKLNADLENIVFDNYVLSVNNNDQLPLMAALGVMAAREAKRDLMSTTETYIDVDD
ncbi:hypothetical protein [Maridesulfovibrio bastinii]|uniref:hypothetical protein n=1 Tax=Maridesulfovibrio bastinii TaxID=47157 RepID=UPI00041C3CA9|nr:hypothetical protein [Maridesulfovibrio bastinii]